MGACSRFVVALGRIRYTFVKSKETNSTPLIRSTAHYPTRLPSNALPSWLGMPPGLSSSDWQRLGYVPRRQVLYATLHMQPLCLQLGSTSLLFFPDTIQRSPIKFVMKSIRPTYFTQSPCSHTDAAQQLQPVRAASTRPAAGTLRPAGRCFSTRQCVP